MYDFKDNAVGAILMQRKDGQVHVIYYADKTYNDIFVGINVPREKV